MNATAYTIVKYKIIYDTIYCVACVHVRTSMYLLSRNNSSLKFSMYCLRIKPMTRF